MFETWGFQNGNFYFIKKNLNNVLLSLHLVVDYNTKFFIVILFINEYQIIIEMHGDDFFIKIGLLLICDCNCHHQ